MKTTSESTAHITKMDLLYIQTHYNCQIWIQESWGAVGPRSSRPGGFVGQWLLQFPGISGALAGAIWKPMASVIRVCSSKPSAAGCNLHKDMMWADVMWYHIIGTYMRYLYISYLYMNIYKYLYLNHDLSPGTHNLKQTNPKVDCFFFAFSP